LRQSRVSGSRGAQRGKHGQRKVRKEQDTSFLS
jgi:hypothetical protein